MKSASISELMSMASDGATITLGNLLSMKDVRDVTEFVKAEGIQISDEAITMFRDAEGNPLPGETAEEKKAYFVGVLFPRFRKKLLAALDTKLDANDLDEISPEKGEALLALADALV